MSVKCLRICGAGEPEWLLEPAPRPATGVRSPALAPGRPSVTSPSEKKKSAYAFVNSLLEGAISLLIRLF